MKIGIRTINDVTILDCSGQLTLGNGTKAVRETTNDILQAGGKKVIFNLADVDYMDSPGVGELVKTYTTFRAKDGQMKLLNLPKRIRDMLAVAKLLTIFEVSNNEQVLVSSFANPAVQRQPMDQGALASGRTTNIAQAARDCCPS
jgi:anti-sigma B factor antagonist